MMFSREEFAKLRDLASRAGVSVSSYLRRCLYEHTHAYGDALARVAVPAKSTVRRTAIR